MIYVMLKWNNYWCLLGWFSHKWIVFRVNFNHFLRFSRNLRILGSFLRLRVRLTLTLALLFLLLLRFLIFLFCFLLLSFLSFLSSFLLCSLLVLFYLLMKGFIQIISYFSVVQNLKINCIN